MLLLTKLIDSWKNALDEDNCARTLLINLSKALTCMPHGVLIANISAHGFNNDACEFSWIEIQL